jgi:enoyl-CoA hydratase/3-hydroxyacyl-CoA dehydrogenase
MGHAFRSLALDTVGVIGSGQIGPDIALFFAKALHAHGTRVVVMDVSAEALAKGEAKCRQKIAKGVESKAFTPADAEGMIGALVFTSDVGELVNAGLIIEAATENTDIKRQIFATLEATCPHTAVLASNSSHIEPEVIFADLRDKSRALVIHYFFPADRNPFVEIVPSADTNAQLTATVTDFYESIGKVPVACGGRYGYAVNPVFEGLFLAAALAVEEGLGTVREVDAAAKRALGLGVGPFTAMNLTGGNPITAHSLDVMTTKLGPWFRVPQLMKDVMATGKSWEVAKRDDPVALPPEQEQRIGDAMRGAYLGLAGQILDSRIITLADLELSLETGLAMRPAFGFMNDLGLGASLALVQAYAAGHPGFAVPVCIAKQAAAGTPFVIDLVLRHDVDGIAVLTIRRPLALNALSATVWTQLHEKFTALRTDASIKGVVLTGFGPKAFVSGADVNFLAGITSPEHGFATSQESKDVGNAIESLGKPVICALNGFALGGGAELAMCCTARIAKKGLPLAVGTPEANLGIIPGAGATQRLPRLVGVETAARMLRTGRGLSGAEAVACGFLREEVGGDLKAAAVELARLAARGEVKLKALDPAPIATPDQLPTVEIGHLSRVIDGIMSRAVVEGCRKPLAEGLRFESEMFAACCATEDMWIGIKNFTTNGPRSKAEFAHK